MEQINCRSLQVTSKISPNFVHFERFRLLAMETKLEAATLCPVSSLTWTLNISL